MGTRAGGLVVLYLAFDIYFAKCCAASAFEDAKRRQINCEHRGLVLLLSEIRCRHIFNKKLGALLVRLKAKLLGDEPKFDLALVTVEKEKVGVKKMYKQRQQSKNTYLRQIRANADSRSLVASISTR